MANITITNKQNNTQKMELSNKSTNISNPDHIHTHTTNISPLRYPGGKTRACKIIDHVILQHFDINCFDTIISPFFGGGSFEFHLQNKYGLKLIVNDKFTPLYNFWRQVKLNKTILCEELRKIKSVSKEHFMAYRNTIMGLQDNILQQSIQYFIINRCSFSGSTLSGGFSEESSSKRFTPSSINKIEALDFSNIEIYNHDFYDFINKESLQMEPNSKDTLDAEYDYYEDPAFKTITNNLEEKNMLSKNEFFVTDDDLVNAQNNTQPGVNQNTSMKAFTENILNIQGLPNGYDPKQSIMGFM